jgi:hypothetical protein
MVDYQNLTDDEVLHLAEERKELTEEAMLALDGELRRRGLSSSDVQTYRAGRRAAEAADLLKPRRSSYSRHRGMGMKFLGKANRQLDPSGKFERYDTTKWFVVYWFPIFPVASFTVCRDLKSWWNFITPPEEIPIERHARNWEQIFHTWIKAVAVVGVIGLAWRILLSHPEWLGHAR